MLVSDGAAAATTPAVTLEEIIRMSKMQFPRWIANRDVMPKWDLTRSPDAQP